MAKLQKQNWDTGFEQVPNDLIDKASFRATGLWAFLAKLPDSWEFSVRGIATIKNIGIDQVRAGIEELEKLGYLKRVGQVRNSKGKFGGGDWQIFRIPPCTEKPTTGKPTSGNPTQLHTIKEHTQINTLSKDNGQSLPLEGIETDKKDEKQEYGNSQINKMFDLWQETFGYALKRTQSDRRAVYNMLRSKDKGEEWLDGMIKAVKLSMSDKYSGIKISNFTELFWNYEKILGWIQRKRAEQQREGFGFIDTTKMTDEQKAMAVAMFDEKRRKSKN